MATTVTALRNALTADPGFAVAAVDLDALTGPYGADPARTGLTIWERRHLDVVAAALANPARAACLLCEHEADSGCDPLARMCVTACFGAVAPPRRPEAPGQAGQGLPA